MSRIETKFLLTLLIASWSHMDMTHRIIKDMFAYLNIKGLKLTSQAEFILDFLQTFFIKTGG